MLPKPCFPSGCPPKLPFRQNWLRLAESVYRLSTALDEPVRLTVLHLQKTPAPEGRGAETAAILFAGKDCLTRNPITELINNMSRTVGRAAFAQKTGYRGNKQQRLPVPDILSHQAKGFHPRTTIRASRRDQALNRIHSDNLSSSRASLADVDSALEMVEFVTEHILSPETGRTRPRQRCLAQKALALLLAE